MCHFVKTRNSKGHQCFSDYFILRCVSGFGSEINVTRSLRPSVLWCTENWPRMHPGAGVAEHTDLNVPLILRTVTGMSHLESSFRKCVFIGEYTVDIDIFCVYEVHHDGANGAK